MAENPLVKVPMAWPVLLRANALRRRAEGRLRSVDLIQWDQVPYGDDIAQRMHIWELNDLCPRDGWPAVLLLHGGGWTEGSWTDFESLAPMLSRRGLMVVALDYRLAPEHTWPAQLDDVLAGLHFIEGQQVDLSRIALWGHSAGGHMALMAGLAASERIRCVVSMGAPTDLPLHAQEGTDRLDLVFPGGQLEAASPLHQIRARGPEALPPTLVVHGALDRVCPVQHAHLLKAAAPKRVTLWELADGDHGLRWPPVAALRIRRDAVKWLVRQLDMPKRGSKWNIGRKRGEK